MSNESEDQQGIDEVVAALGVSPNIDDWTESDFKRVIAWHGNQGRRAATTARRFMNQAVAEHGEQVRDLFPDVDQIGRAK